MTLKGCAVMNKNIAIFITTIFIVIMLFPAVCVSAKEAELNVSFTSTENSITLEWKSEEKIQQSTVYKYNSAKKKFTKLASTPKKSYTEKKLDAGERVQYKITAKLKDGKTVSKIITANTLLEDIPMHDGDYQGSKKAFVHEGYSYSEDDGSTYYLIYHNCNGEKIICKSNDSFDADIAVSEDGTVVYYVTDRTVYRYSYLEGKSKKITKLDNHKYSHFNFDYYQLTLSPDGEYCAVSWRNYIEHPEYFNNYESMLTICHNGKTVTAKDGYYADNHCISNEGKVFFTYNYDDEISLYLFSFDTGKLEKFAVINDEYYPLTDVYFDKNSYIVEAEKLYYGKIGAAPKKSYSDFYTVKECDGKSAIITTDNDTVYRLNLENGDSLELADSSSAFACTEDMDTVVFCDYQSKKLVRLSGWNEKENCYKNRQEISVPELSQSQIIDSYSPDLNIVYIIDESIEGSDRIAYFDSGVLQKTERSYPIIDRFGNVLFSIRGEKWYLMEPDGSERNVFEDDTECTLMNFDFINGFVIFGVDVPCYDSDGLLQCGDYAEYYIDENGKPVFLWDDRAGYEVTYD